MIIMMKKSIFLSFFLPSSSFKSLLWAFFFILLINVSSALTQCSTIVRDVALVAFGNYLSFTSGLLLTFFSSPSDEDEGFFVKIKRLVIRTAATQFMVLLALLTFMTIRFFPLNNKNVSILLNVCSIIMYSLCGAISLTQFIPNRVWRNIFRGFFFVPLYIIQMIFQVSLKIDFPATGYMFVFQWISILSILLAIPLFYIVYDRSHKGRLIYAFIYPFVFQVYLHVGYVCFFLYCNEGYLSSILLFFSGFALSNVIRSAFYLVFPKEQFPNRDNP